MHHSYLDRYAQGESPVHRLDARAKLLAVVAYTAVVISFDRYALAALAPMVIGPVAMMWFGQVPVSFALRRVAVLSPFIVTLCLFSPLYDHSPHWVALGPWGMTVSGGWLTAANLACKFALGVLALTAMMSTTPFSLLLEGMRKLGAPRLLAMQLGLLYRYLFLVMDEGMRIRRGRDFRGAGRAPLTRRLPTAGAVIGTLFLRTLDRSERIALAMSARGWRGEPHGLTRLRFRPADAAFLAGAAAYLAACRWGYPLLL
jgi:cobalt/nickel transport system permease protein